MPPPPQDYPRGIIPGLSRDFNLDRDYRSRICHKKTSTEENHTRSNWGMSWYMLNITKRSTSIIWQMTRISAGEYPPEQPTIATGLCFWQNIGNGDACERSSSGKSKTCVYRKRHRVTTEQRWRNAKYVVFRAKTMTTSFHLPFSGSIELSGLYPKHCRPPFSCPFNFNAWMFI